MSTTNTYTPFRLGVKFDKDFTSIENAVRNYGTRPHIEAEYAASEVQPIYSELSDPVINMIVLGHATFNKENPGNLKDALKMFTAPRGLSAHDLVHHEADKDGNQVFHLVNYEYKAWHSGVSSWGKPFDALYNVDENGVSKTSAQIGVNDNSIGVWMVAKEATLTQYPETQIQRTAYLLDSIVAAYHIHPLDVTGFHDVKLCQAYDSAKIGLPLSVKLPWPELFKLTPGLQQVNQILEKHANEPSTVKFTFNDASVDGSEDVKNAQGLLHKIGYTIVETGILDNNTKCAIHAFNMHYNQGEFSQSIMDEAGWVTTWTDRAQHVAEDLAALRNEGVLAESAHSSISDEL